jgi:DNA ligase 1
MKEMFYDEFVEVYDALYATTKRLEKEKILAEFLKKLDEKGESEWIYLLRGRVFPDYDEREFGVSNQLAAKAIAFAFGMKEEEISHRYKKIGDLGEIAEEFAKKKRQMSLFSSKLTVKKVFSNLQKLFDMQGKGAVKGKTDLVAELLGNASGKEAKYIVRTLLGQLRVGVADAILKEAIAETFFPEEKAEMSPKVEVAFDMLNDSAAVFEATKKGKKALEKVELVVGRPMNVMLPIKVTEIGEAFRICGKPAAIEHKYDGFRVVISKKNDEIKLFTRRLENVTKQFPDVVKVIEGNVKGNEFVLDSEVVGYDPKTKVPKPFEAISQRIRRKYDIEKLEKELPVEINIFDVMYHNGQNLMEQPFRKRREFLEKIIKDVKFKIRLSKQIVTDSEEEAMKFYHDALKIGEEGIMVKNLEAPYQQGRRVGNMVKLKPVVNDLDLVIVAAEYGSGKRGGWLTSYTVACRDDDKFVEIGKVSSGLKEKEESEGTSYEEMNELLKPLIVREEGKEVRVKPKIVVAVTYQNIQRSPSYSSGWAMRFPRITAYRPDKSVKEIATLEEIEKEAKRVERGRERLG